MRRLAAAGVVVLVLAAVLWGQRPAPEEAPPAGVRMEAAQEAGYACAERPRGTVCASRE